MVVMTTEVLRNMIYARSSTLAEPRLRGDGRGALPGRPLPRCGLGRGDHRAGRLDPGGRAVGDGQQRRGVRRVAVRGARRDGRRGLRAPAGTAVPARPGRAAALRPVRRVAPTAPGVGRGAGEAGGQPGADHGSPGRSRASSETTPGARAAGRGRGRQDGELRQRAYGGAAHRSRYAGAGPPVLARCAAPSRPELVELLDDEALLPAIVFIFSRVGCDAAVRQLLGVRGPADQRRSSSRRSRRSWSGTSPDCPTPTCARSTTTRFAEALSRGVAAHHAGMLPDLQGVRRGGVRPRADQGRLRHRDAGARHQHAGPVGGAGEAGQVQRRDPRRRHAGGVHPADRPGGPAGHRRRGPRGRAVAARAWIRARSPGWRRGVPIRCGPRSLRPTTWRSTWSAASAGSGPGPCWSSRSPSSSPTARWSGWPARWPATTEAIDGVLGGGRVRAR